MVPRRAGVTGATANVSCVSKMMIGLAELNDSRYSGTVWLGPSADNTQTEVSVILLEPTATS